MIDWLGVSLSLLIILAIIIIVIAKVQGDRVVDVLSELLAFIRGEH